MTGDGPPTPTFPVGGPPRAGTPPAPMLRGRRFFKMSGSGNDFVFFDNRTLQHEDLVNPSVIGAICDRRRGIGADGVVLISQGAAVAFDMRYYNRDGSLAEMCGNAALCSATLAGHLGIVAGTGHFVFSTPSGPVTAQLTPDGPALGMTPVTELAADVAIPRHSGERRIGYARVGVPHLVILVDDAESVDVVGRGRELRHHPSLRDGANVNFVATDRAGRWVMRTYERGVEDETLACGTGTVACVALLTAWQQVPGSATLLTRSGRPVWASVSPDAPPVLRGEGRLVADGTIDDLPVSSA